MTDSTFAERAAAWLHGHDTGLSSEAIFHYMTLGVKGGSTPSDGGDLGRCVRLLARFPEWVERMPEMACVSDDWAALMGIWDDVVAAYRDDAANKGSGRPWKSDAMLSELWYERFEGLLKRRDHGAKAAA